jgi:mannose-6-phosphate isomerase-like protein (cupin superfamily)
MNIIKITELAPLGGGSPRFEGMRYGASASCFVVTSAPGEGAHKHRHPYDETFLILDGVIEAIIAGEMCMVEQGYILVIPANTWHEFKNRSGKPLLMVNIHPAPQMIQEDWTIGSIDSK